MTHRSRVPVGIVSAAASTFLWASPASAQQPPAASNSQDTLETVTITGTLLKRTDTETPSPVQVISAGDLKSSGYTNVADVLRNISANGSGTLPPEAPSISWVPTVRKASRKIPVIRGAV